ncbi:MAG: hypothetical protein IJQ66_00395 [Clostridia bacterium]|nr:hypothetical protein [Clostridia bacterium]
MAKRNIGKTITYLLILLVVVAVIGFVAHYTNGFTGDFKTFYVTVNGKDVMTSAGGYEVSNTKPLNVTVKYTFGALSDEAKGYSVKIVPNKVEGKNFDFSVEGETYSFFAEKDLSAGFYLAKEEQSFTVTPKGGTFTEVLQAIYRGQAVSDCEDYVYEDMFTLIVTSYNGEAAVTLNFSVTGVARGISFDKGVMVF